jgi:hypothetical protein
MSLPPPEHRSQFDDALVRTLERLAKYGVFLRQRGRPAVVRAAGHGILRIIREELGEVEIDDSADSSQLAKREGKRHE